MAGYYSNTATPVACISCGTGASTCSTVAANLG